MLPTFVLLGTMRGGTTSLMRYLAAHPEVYVAAEKEVHFFDQRFDRGVPWYEKQFANRGNARAFGEGTPAYLYGDITMQRLKEVLPEAQLIVSLREPVERAWSHYWHQVARGKERREFLEAITKEDEMKPAPGGVVRGYLAKGHYLQYLRQLEPDRDAGRLHVLLFEEFRDDPAREFAGVCRFLGVDDSVVPDLLGSQLNPYIEFRSLRVRRWGKKLPKPLRDAVGKVNIRNVDYQPLDPDLRTRLRAEFTADNAALAEWLGRDLSIWDP